MNLIFEIEQLVSGDSLQKEGVEVESVLLGETRVHALKVFTVLRVKVARQFHPQQHHPEFFLLKILDQGGQILFAIFKRKVAQTIVGAEAEQNHVERLLFEIPLDSAQTLAARVPTHSGVGHVDGDALLKELFLESGRVALLGGHRIARREAVAESEHVHRFWVA